MAWDVIVGDCREVMAGMAEASVDAIVTDPPYELGFMGKAWDRSGVAFDAETWRAALRVLKPGGHLLAFGGSRTFHRIAVAIEDAGFDIRDTISWLYGSGFPKSHDVSKAMDREAGAEREVIKGGGRSNIGTGARSHGPSSFSQVLTDSTNERTVKNDISLPATDLARQWDGWGTALKPAWEPVIVARKPLVGTVARNVAAYGTGAINVDACRIPVSPDDPVNTATWHGNGERTSYGQYATDVPGHKFTMAPPPAGRWPANVILDEEAGAMLDEQTDGASWFFYCAKASRGERNAGLEGMAEREKHIYSSGIVSADHPGTAAVGGARPSTNHHPTVKPIALMRYLARLVTPPGGVVLDPFTGSGTTGCAAALEGFGFVGVEMSPEYAEIARRRIAHWGRQIPLEVPR